MEVVAVDVGYGLFESIGWVFVCLVLCGGACCRMVMWIGLAVLQFI